jgi:hypothetical protein
MSAVSNHKDPELDAMTTTLGVIKELEPAAQERVVKWIISKLGINVSIGQERKKPLLQGKATNDTEDENLEAEEGVGTYSSFAELCSAASVNTDAEKAVVAGYWFQICKNQEVFTSQECNEALKHFGTPIKNVTRAFEYLKDAKPQLAMQMEKSGKSMQARKKFKLTHAGIQKVKGMLRHE